MGSEMLVSEPVAVMITPKRFMCRNIDRKTGRTRKNVHLYVAETLCSKAKIKPNPENGIREHDEVVWVPFSKVEGSKIHAYLIPGVMWAIDQYSKSRPARKIAT